MLFYELQRSLCAARLQALALERKKECMAADPFPHIAIDGLIPEAYLRKLAKEFPEISQEEAAKGGEANCGYYAERHKCSMGNDGPRVMSTPYARGFYSMMLSPDFTQFLETLTGIQGIIADSAFSGSGFDQTLPGGSLAIHTDFHLNKPLKLTRRVNTFLYLNPDWEPSYGGDLELWSVTKESLNAKLPKPHKMEKKIAPTWGRLVVFTTGDRSFHGHPMPLNTTTRNRRSIATTTQMVTRSGSSTRVSITPRHR